MLNLIYGAHNGRGVGLPNCLSFLAKFHYIEFWVTSYTRGGCPLKPFFLKTSEMEITTFCGFLISYMVPILVGEWVYQIVFQYHVDCFFMTFAVATYTRGGWPGVANFSLVNFIKQCSRTPVKISIKRCYGKGKQDRSEGHQNVDWCISRGYNIWP